jgi:voltage-gated potassium channel
MALPHHPDKQGLLDSIANPFELLKGGIRQLYEGESLGGVRFRYALLLFDFVTVFFIIVTSFLPRSRAIESLDLVFGLLILADFSARLIISRHPLQEFTRLSTWTDIVVIISFLAPLAGEAGGFLRTLRTLRLLRDVQMVAASH